MASLQQEYTEYTEYTAKEIPPRDSFLAGQMDGWLAGWSFRTLSNSGHLFMFIFTIPGARIRVTFTAPHHTSLLYCCNHLPFISYWSTLVVCAVLSTVLYCTVLTPADKHTVQPSNRPTVVDSGCAVSSARKARPGYGKPQL